MKRRTILVLLVITMLVIGTSVEAAVNEMVVSPSLSISGKTASCYLRVSKPGKSINATLELYRDGVPIVSWTQSGSSTVVISETYTVTSGHTYYLYAYGTAGGTAFNGQSISITI